MLRKTIEVLAVLSLLVVFVLSVAFPESPFMWLATTSTTFTVLRIVLITLLATLLITDEFFDHHLHWFLGIFAAVLGVWTMLAAYNSELQILDGLSFLAAAVSLGIEALEPGVDSREAEPDAWQRLWIETKHRAAVYALAAYVMTRSIALNHSTNRHLTVHGGQPPSAA